MKRHINRLVCTGLAAAGLTTAVNPVAAAPAEEFDEFLPIVEVNASDGDVGFHVLLDGEAWRNAAIHDPDDQVIFRARDFNALREQGLTELFMESAEPPCWHDTESEDYDPEEVVTVADFVSRFLAGEYTARGRTIDGEVLKSYADLTHNLPAAPDTEVEVDEEDDGEYDVTISWEGGDDLGECEFAIGSNEGEIPDPSSVEIVRWEIVVEPDEDTFLEETGLEEWPEELAETKFSIQLPGESSEVEVPEEFFAPYIEAGMYYFKYEVGGREESGNQTFTEDEFTVGI